MYEEGYSSQGAASAYSAEDESDYSTEVSHMIHLGAPLEFTFKAAEIKITISQ